MTKTMKLVARGAAALALLAVAAPALPCGAAKTTASAPKERAPAAAPKDTVASKAPADKTAGQAKGGQPKAKTASAAD